MTRKEPSVDFRFASAVAEFALLLEDSKHKGDASFAKLIERARNAKGEDCEGYRAEFIRLAETVELMDAKASKEPQMPTSKTPRQPEANTHLQTTGNF